jgi:two-component system C4-dicarboxylate transport sensor histidine kinase DctB
MTGVPAATVSAFAPASPSLAWRRFGRPALVAAMALAVAAAAYVAREVSLRNAFARLDDAALRQLDLYASVVEHELGRQDDLPGLLDVDGDIEALLTRPSSDALRAAASRRLTRFTVRAGMLATEVVDREQRVVAASDGFEPGTAPRRTPVSEACARDALAGGDARVFLLSPTGGPEVCLGRQIRRAGAALGAVLIRMSLAPIEATWTDAAFRDDSERPVVVDESGRIILSAVPGWKGRTLAEIGRTEQSFSHGVLLARLVGTSEATTPLVLVHERPLARFGWKLHVLTSTRQVWRDARAAAWGAGTAAASGALLLVVLLQRRRVIAQKLATREALQRAHDQLEEKVRERTAELEQANTGLRRAQQELLQAEKLALLGQMSAGISHELGQPLTALRGLADNARVLLARDRLGEVEDNLSHIADVVGRMGRITAQLKSFVRKTTAVPGPVLLADAVDGARRLLAPRLEADGVRFEADVPPHLQALCDGHRLEQVLVNLLANALDAVRASEERAVSVRAQARGDRAVIRVSDTGPGLAPEVREHLFEPFFTTKPVGEGVGLGLVISAHIVQEWGGVLRALPSARGAEFEIDLPLQRTEHLV